MLCRVLVLSERQIMKKHFHLDARNRELLSVSCWQSQLRRNALYHQSVNPNYFSSHLLDLPASKIKVNVLLFISSPVFFISLFWDYLKNANSWEFLLFTTPNLMLLDDLSWHSAEGRWITNAWRLRAICNFITRCTNKRWRVNICYVMRSARCDPGEA
jgi:hypothetical protein